jgi:hypothetical protein
VSRQRHFLRIRESESAKGCGIAATNARIAREITGRCARLRRRVAQVDAKNLAKLFVVKKSRRFKFDEVRQRFRLTPTERGVAVFVAAAFVLGLVTKCYRDAHPSPTPIERHSTTMKSMSRSTSTSKRKIRKAHDTLAVKPGDPARRLPKSEEKLDLSDSATKQEYRQK